MIETRSNNMGRMAELAAEIESIQIDPTEEEMAA